MYHINLQRVRNVISWMCKNLQKNIGLCLITLFHSQIRDIESIKLKKQSCFINLFINKYDLKDSAKILTAITLN